MGAAPYYLGLLFFMDFLYLRSLPLWFFMPVLGFVWLGGLVLVAANLALTGIYEVAAEVVQGAFAGIIALAALTLPGNLLTF